MWPQNRESFTLPDSILYWVPHRAAMVNTVAGANFSVTAYNETCAVRPERGQAVLGAAVRRLHNCLRTNVRSHRLQMP